MVSFSSHQLLLQIHSHSLQIPSGYCTHKVDFFIFWSLKSSEALLDKSGLFKTGKRKGVGSISSWMLTRGHSRGGIVHKDTEGIMKSAYDKISHVAVQWLLNWKLRLTNHKPLIPWRASARKQPQCSHYSGFQFKIPNQAKINVRIVCYWAWSDLQSPWKARDRLGIKVLNMWRLSEWPLAIANNVTYPENCLSVSPEC